MRSREGLYRKRKEQLRATCSYFRISLNTSSSALTDFINRQTRTDRGNSSYTVKNRLVTFPSPAWMSLTKLSPGGNN
jgi:hypothetical protein